MFSSTPTPPSTTNAPLSLFVQPVVLLIVTAPAAVTSRGVVVDWVFEELVNPKCRR